MTDYIDRQAAIDELHMNLMYRMGTDSNKQRLDEWINNLPSAESERKNGEWINYKDEHCCSVCQSVVIQENWDDDIWYDYYPYCGAEMRGDNE